MHLSELQAAVAPGLGLSAAEMSDDIGAAGEHWLHRIRDHEQGERSLDITDLGAELGNIVLLALSLANHYGIALHEYVEADLNARGYLPRD